jgi:endonuclease V-like protein UPF0215 family
MESPLKECFRSLDRLREVLKTIEAENHTVEVEHAIELAQQLGIDLEVAEAAIQKKK